MKIALIVVVVLVLLVLGVFVWAMGERNALVIEQQREGDKRLIVVLTD